MSAESGASSSQTPSDAAKWTRDGMEAVAEFVHLPLLVLDEKLRVLWTSKAYQQNFGPSATASEGRVLVDLMDGAWDFAELRSALERLLETHGTYHGEFHGLQAERELRALGRRSLSLSGRALATPTGDRMVMLAVEDITGFNRDDRALIEAIRDAQSRFITAEEPRDVFARLLESLLQLTNSEYGFITELLSTQEGQPSLAVRAITDIAWNEESRKLYPQFLSGELHITNMASLIGAVVTTGAPVSANDAPNDPRRGSLPPGHPSVKAFLGLPLRSGREFVGVLGLANAPGGYGPTTVAYLEPMVSACANIISSLRNEERRKLADQAANRLKQEFLIHMSHEIRTPLNAVLGFTYLALGNPMNEEQRDYLDNIHRAGQTLLRIVNDILDLSKIEAGKLELERVGFGVRGVLDRQTRMMAPKAAEKGLTLRVEVAREVPHRLLGDPTRLGQVLLNLLSNAIKFTEAGEVAVSVRSTRVPSSEGAVDTGALDLHIQVKDTGIGIPAEQVGSLFQAFSQAHTSITRSYGGTGLGLVICKRLVQLMGGEITVESAPGKGSTFAFTARLGIDESDESQPARAAAVEVKALEGWGRRVLVVDDNRVNRRIARELLESAGLRVDEAEDGAQAVRRLLEAQPESPWDLVLMDLQMPIMDGYTATRTLRQDPRFRQLPIVAMTAHALPEERGRCEAAGMNDYLSKPVVPELLFATVGRWLPISPSPETPPDSGKFCAIADVDTEGGLARLAGNAALYRTLLLGFAAAQAERTAELQAAFNQGNPVLAGRLAHRLKGEAGSLGLTSVLHLAAELEANPQNGNILRTLAEEMARSGRQIMEALPPPAPGGGGGFDKARLQELLDRLRRHLEADEGGAVGCSEELQALLQGNLEADRFLRLTRLVQEFDFEAALAELHNLSGG